MEESQMNDVAREKLQDGRIAGKRQLYTVESVELEVSVTRLLSLIRDWRILVSS